MPNKAFKFACWIYASYFVLMSDDLALTTDTWASKTSKIVVDPWLYLTWANFRSSSAETKTVSLIGIISW